jgi:hypothetical protein
VIAYGQFINDVISFLVIAMAVFVLVKKVIASRARSIHLQPPLRRPRKNARFARRRSRSRRSAAASVRLNSEGIRDQESGIRAGPGSGDRGSGIGRGSGIRIRGSGDRVRGSGDQGSGIRKQELGQGGAYISTCTPSPRRVLGATGSTPLL